jgi:hypothetical protein
MLKNIICAAAFLGLAATADAREGGGHGGGHGGHGRDQDFRFYTCRAESLTHEGIFFLGMGRTEAEAYFKAQRTCQRQRMICDITCTVEF